MINFNQVEQKDFNQYTELLQIIAQLSKLFSDNSVPFINYRVAENLFCRCFNAENLSRSDTAFDAKYGNLGIGIKTFIINKNSSYEKIAEFNNLSAELKKHDRKDLAVLVSTYRNERISLAKRLYQITKSQYHIVARKNAKILLFDTEYDYIDINKISNVHQTKASVSFNDGKKDYRYFFSKSTLFQKFELPPDPHSIDINILDDPYSLLQDINNKIIADSYQTDKSHLEYIILPLYGKHRIIYPKSGLNQWNAEGRKRDFGELYIPIPMDIHHCFPNFFPQREDTFNLKIPTGEVFSAKVCQANGKALMTNPNKLLSDWLLRTVLQLKEGELATIEKLDKLGFDSVIITKSNNENEYLIDIRKTGSYEEFMNLT